MLKSHKTWLVKGQRGDTLIEVTFALAILGFVLLGSTAIVAAAFRTGQTARERIQVSEAAQQQMEALHSFRDNHTWSEFRTGGAGYDGIDDMTMSTCDFDPAKKCFHFEVGPAGATLTDWVPKSGSTTGPVPTSVIEISTSTDFSLRNCGYDFELHYAFTPLGGSSTDAKNQIVTRLANLRYNSGLGGCPTS